MKKTIFRSKEIEKAYKKLSKIYYTQEFSEFEILVDNNLAYIKSVGARKYIISENCPFKTLVYCMKEQLEKITGNNQNFPAELRAQAHLISMFKGFYLKWLVGVSENEKPDSQDVLNALFHKGTTTNFVSIPFFLEQEFIDDISNLGIKTEEISVSITKTLCQRCKTPILIFQEEAVKECDKCGFTFTSKN